MSLTDVLDDTVTMSGRSLRHSARNVEVLLTAVLLPVVLMLLFVYVFGGALETGTTYVTYVLPGIILLCASFGATTTAVSVATDLTNGIVDRFRTMPITVSAVLTGHVVASVARNLVATVLVLGAGIAVGFRPDATAVEWVAALALVVLFVLALSWLSALIGLAVGSPEAASGSTFLLLFLPYVSSAFVPTDSMPGWLQVVAEHQPVTPMIEALRGLLTGTAVGSSALLAVVEFGALLVVSWVAAAVVFRRRTR